MVYWKTSRLLIRVFNHLEWHKSRSEKVIYLTFDDGPTLEVTERVLEILKKFKAKATFFCLGRNVERHREIYNKIINDGHATGNHTYSHLRGWKTPLKIYIQDTLLGAKYISSDLFRPPYGRMTRNQSKYLRQQYKIIMWDVLSHDYNQLLPAWLCLKMVLRSTRNGSIVVFHDSFKASKNMLYVLPKFLEHFQKKGYKFETI